MAHDRAAVTPRGYQWPLLVVGLLVAQVGLGVTAAYLAVRDPSHTVTPGYHAKALAWEEQAKRLSASNRLRWSATAEFVGGHLQVRLLDREGAPIRGASVVATVFHHARGKDASTLTLQANKSGVYETPFRPDRPGVWEIRVTAARGDERFLWTEAREHTEAP